jgi:hypothetical protein
MNSSEFGQPSSPSPPPPSAAANIPVRAAICALIPGIGAVYNREYMKAVVHFAVFAGLCIVAESIGIFGLAAFSFYVYTVIDAYRSAEAILRRGDQPNVEGNEINFPLWGGVLVLMGILFLLDNLGAISLRATIQFWPVILIFLGLYLIFSFAMAEKERKAARASKHSIEERSGGGEQ